MATNEERRATTGDVVLQVCVKCGREVQFEAAEEIPSDLKCEKCGNQVFRTFEDSASPGEAMADFRDETDRDLATDDAAGDATRGDLHDLNNP